MQALLLLFCLLFSIHSYATSNDDGISVVDSPLIASTDRSIDDTPAAPLNHTDDSRLSACENNLQDLVGRVEVLEHAVKELQGKPSQATLSPDTPLGAQAQSIAPVPTSGSEEKREYDLALAALKESRFNDAENLFAAFMQKNTHSELMGNAYFWYAESFYRRGEFDKAAVHYLKGYKQYPKSPKAADNLLKLALSLGELKKHKDGCAMLSKLEAEYKNRPASSVKRANDAKAKYCK